MKVKIRIEKEDAYVEKELTPEMVCAAFDLQFMIGCWDALEINHIEEEMRAFFHTISHIDEVMHSVQLEERGREVSEDWIWGEPEWEEYER